jgi:hypothetical protein
MLYVFIDEIFANMTQVSDVIPELLVDDIIPCSSLLVEKWQRSRYGFHRHLAPKINEFIRVS